MQNRKTVIIGMIVVLLIALPIIWYLASPLFINKSVDEAFPVAMPAGTDIDAMPEDEKMALETEFMTAVPDAAGAAEMPAEERETAAQPGSEAAATVVMTDQNMAETMPAAADEWIVQAAGEFVDADNAHQGSGSAAIYQQGDQVVLRLENFEVTNGPDLHVLLTKNPNPANRAEVGEEYIDLGELKGNVGDQNYDIPADIDLSEYQGVVIYCVPFHVVFATAALS